MIIVLLLLITGILTVTAVNAETDPLHGNYTIGGSAEIALIWAQNASSGDK
jgi:hypothetical protein